MNLPWYVVQAMLEDDIDVLRTKFNETRKNIMDMGNIFLKAHAFDVSLAAEIDTGLQHYGRLLLLQLKQVGGQHNNDDDKPTQGCAKQVIVQVKNATKVLREKKTAMMAALKAVCNTINIFRE